MRALDVIAHKRDGLELSREEIDYFVTAYTRGEIPDYQAAAWVMAVYIRGMDDRETGDLTLAMARSGDILDLGDTVPLAVDKHSTGGVGDKVSLVVAPTAAACGLPIAKITGRGLAFTGGTLDKLESIPGYRVNLSEAEFKAQLAQIGVVLTGQTREIAPADRKLYALRDATATVGSLPLIVSSILSKKIAGGADAVVLDVKVGSGALMKTLDDGIGLAQALVHLGSRVGLRVVARISDMNQPLGRAVGNALEVREAIATLHNRGPADFREHCLVIVAEMLALGGVVPGPDRGIEVGSRALASGAAWSKFRQLVSAQGGDVRSVENPARLPQADLTEVVPLPQDGWLAGVDAAEVGMTVMALGGGRAEKGDVIDHSVGVVVNHRVGDTVHKGEPLCTIHSNSPAKLREARERLLGAHSFSDSPVEPLPLFYGRVAG